MRIPFFRKAGHKSTCMKGCYLPEDTAILIACEVIDSKDSRDIILKVGKADWDLHLSKNFFWDKNLLLEELHKRVQKLGTKVLEEIEQQEKRKEF